MSEMLKLSSITADAGTQTRACVMEEVIADYADHMKAAAIFPPIVVFFDGKSHFLADGFHRYLAALRIERKVIRAEVRKGSRLDAIKFALGANQANGLRRTNADKRHCVELALKEFSKLSDRAIAEMCGVDHKTVASIRTEHEQLGKIPSGVIRIGRDGSERPSERPLFRQRIVDGKHSLVVDAMQPNDTRGGREEKYEPESGLQFAEMAIEQLKRIHPDDKQRKEAFELVITWINKQRK